VAPFGEFARGSGKHAEEARLLVEELLGRAFEQDLAAVLSPGRAQHDQVIRPANDARVVLDHDHRVSRVAQSMEDREHACSVGCVESYRRLIQDVEGPRQRGAEPRGEADPLGLPAAQSASGARQGEIAEPYVLEIVEPLADLGQNCPDARLFFRRQLEPRKLAGQISHRQVLHLGKVERADAHRQSLRTQSRRSAVGTRYVSAIAGEEDPHVGPIALALQLLEQSLHAAVPAVAREDPVLLRRGEITVGKVERDAVDLGLFEHPPEGACSGLGVERRDRSLPERAAWIWYHLGAIDDDLATETLAGWTGAQRRVRRKVARAERLPPALATRTGGAVPQPQAGGNLTEAVDRALRCIDPPGRLDRFSRARRTEGSGSEAIHHQERFAHRPLGEIGASFSRRV
jgi:hypothetical protein